MLGAVAIACDEWLRCIEDKINNVGFRNSDTRLELHIRLDIFFLFKLHAARVCENATVAADFRFVIDAVARGAGYVRGDSDPLSDKTIKEGGFSHIRTADDGDDG